MLRRTGSMLAALVAGAAVFAGPNAATAQSFDSVERSEKGNWSFGVAATTMGVGPEAAIRLTPNFVARIGAYYGELDTLGIVLKTSGNSGFVTTTAYEIGEVETIAGRALIDWHPFRDSGRITVGVGYLNQSGLANLRETTNTTTVRLADTDYPVAATRGLKAEFKTSNPVMPYFGFGYDNAYFKDYGLSISTDFGALWGLKHDVELTGGTGAITAADRAAEAKKLNEKFNNLSFYPVASLAVRYRF